MYGTPRNNRPIRALSVGESPYLFRQMKTLDGPHLSFVQARLEDWEQLCGTLDFDMLIMIWNGNETLAVIASAAAKHLAVVVVADSSSNDAPATALEAGADDFISAPISRRELYARLSAVSRRLPRFQIKVEKRIVVGTLCVDPLSKRVSVDGLDVVLTEYEFAILYALAEAKGAPLTREQLLDQAKGDVEGAFTRSVDVRISRIRQKIEKNPKSPRLLVTVRGRGYRLASPSPSP